MMTMMMTMMMMMIVWCILGGALQGSTHLLCMCLCRAAQTPAVALGPATAHSSLVAVVCHSSRSPPLIRLQEPSVEASQGRPSACMGTLTHLCPVGRTPQQLRAGWQQQAGARCLRAEPSWPRLLGSWRTHRRWVRPRGQVSLDPEIRTFKPQGRQVASGGWVRSL